MLFISQYVVYRLDMYYGMENTFDYHHILRHLDVLVDNFDAYMEHLFANSNNVVKHFRLLLRLYQLFL